VIRDAQGKAYSVRYDAVNAMLLNEFLKQHDKVSKLEGIVAGQAKQLATQEQTNADQAKILAQQQKDFRTTLTQQQQEISTLTASLKEQASLLQEVSARMQVMRSSPRVVSNN
jgi:septal ring factor EnvC (AmiA/AmiB activator)